MCCMMFFQDVRINSVSLTQQMEGVLKKEQGETGENVSYVSMRHHRQL